MQANILIGLAAGFVSAVLFASVSTGTLLGLFVLFFLSPLPVAVAGLGWGWRAALVAAVAGAIAVGFFGNVRGALFHAVALGGPTALLSYYCLLHRDVTDERGTTTTEWYPLGRVVLIAAVMAGALAAIGLFTIATDMDGLRGFMKLFVDRIVTPPPGVPRPPGMPTTLDPEQLAGLTNILVSLLTVSLATTWLTIAMLNMWLAGHVVARSSRLVRPWPELSELRLPPTAAIALAVTLGATFLSDMPGLVAAGFAGSILLAYTLVGLAIVHSITRGNPLRPMMLTATYVVLLLFFAFAGPALAVFALSETFFSLRRKPPQGPAASI